MTRPTAPKTELLAQAPTTSPSAIGRVIGRIARQPAPMVALGFLVVLGLVAVFAPLLAPYDPNEVDYSNQLLGPVPEHWLGTDEYGRDTLSRIMFGARVALAVAFGAATVAIVLGVPIGLLLGFRGGWSDRIGTRFIDILDALPGTLVAFAIIAILGRGLWQIMLAIGFIFVMNVARMTRAVTLAERNKAYVDAANVTGLRQRAIIFEHVLPNLVGPLLVQTAILMGGAIGIESALSFLGIGLEQTDSSWGGMLSTASAKQALQPFLAFPPGIAIVLTVLAFNTFADGVNDALIGDRRRRRRRPAAGTPAAVAAARSASTPGTSEAVLGTTDAVLEVREVTIVLDRPGAPAAPLVRNASLSIARGEILGVIGESGSGKSTLARSILGLLPPVIHVESGQILLEGAPLVGRSARELDRLRGREMSAVFQDPMGSLSPVHKIGRQLTDAIRATTSLSARAARERAVHLLDRVGVVNPRERLGAYPHEFSGGMAQRVAIARALAGSPKLLIADEPTSALDVTTQAQVLDLLLDLRDEFQLSILLITHDMGVVAESCDRAIVMYQGEIVEAAEVHELFAAPKNEYTKRLLAAYPSAETPKSAKEKKQ